MRKYPGFFPINIPNLKNVLLSVLSTQETPQVICNEKKKFSEKKNKNNSNMLLYNKGTKIKTSNWNVKFVTTIYLVFSSRIAFHVN